MLLKYLIYILIVAGIFYIFAVVGGDALDRWWEARCPVWYHIGTSEYEQCMSRSVSP